MIIQNKAHCVVLHLKPHLSVANAMYTCVASQMLTDREKWDALLSSGKRRSSHLLVMEYFTLFVIWSVSRWRRWGEQQGQEGPENAAIEI